MRELVEEPNKHKCATLKPNVPCQLELATKDEATYFCDVIKRLQSLSQDPESQLYTWPPMRDNDVAPNQWPVPAKGELL